MSAYIAMTDVSDVEVPAYASTGLVIQPVKTVFKDIHFDVKGSEGERKVLLDKVSGSFEPGELVAIMGPSGAGKTTLMNFLAGVSVSGFTGEVLLNGGPRDLRQFRKLSRIVMQEDHHYATLTVRETVTAAARLQLPKGANFSERIEDVIRELGLEGTEGVRVGSSSGIGKKGLSGGQRKRLSIALELIAQPSLLFLDEPTSGLDSGTALSVVDTLRAITNRTKCTVVCTIHQPSARLFSVFDKLILLERGRLVYYGATKDVISVLSNVGMECPQYNNPADFVLECLAVPGDRDALVADVEKRRPYLAEIEEPPKYPPTHVDTSRGRYPVSLLSQFMLLLVRAGKCGFRDVIVGGVRTVAHVAMALIMGMLYFQVDNYQSHIEDRMACLFMNMLLLHLLSILPTVLTFPLEEVIFMREHSNSHFGVLPYFFARVLAEVPFLVVLPVLYGLLTYFLMGFQTDFGRIMIYIVVLVLHSFTGQSLGLIVSAACPNIIVAVLAAPLAAIPPYMFVGFLVQLDNIPVWFRWIEWVSPVKYPYVALMRNEFDGLKLKCKSDELTPSGDCPLTKGIQVLKKEEMDHSYDKIWICILVMVGFVIVMNVVSYVILKLKAKKRR